MGTFILLTIWLGLMMLIIQRTEARRRRVVSWLMLLMGGLTLLWAATRGLAGVMLGALLAALALNFFFWLFIGRYNPVGSSDDIQVIGLDD